MVSQSQRRFFFRVKISTASAARRSVRAATSGRLKPPGSPPRCEEHGAADAQPNRSATGPRSQRVKGEGSVGNCQRPAPGVPPGREPGGHALTMGNHRRGNRVPTLVGCDSAALYYNASDSRALRRFWSAGGTASARRIRTRATGICKRGGGQVGRSGMIERDRPSCISGWGQLVPIQLAGTSRPRPACQRAGRVLRDRAVLFERKLVLEHGLAGGRRLGFFAIGVRVGREEVPRDGGLEAADEKE